uniref:Solute carrier family 43 member 3 n=1 Tax=Anas platyrhynchos platyrhynchos TaxID=8840 RepID=U3J7P1_ANAPP
MGFLGVCQLSRASQQGPGVPRGCDWGSPGTQGCGRAPTSGASVPRRGCQHPWGGASVPVTVPLSPGGVPASQGLCQCPYSLCQAPGAGCACHCPQVLSSMPMSPGAVPGPQGRWQLPGTGCCGEIRRGGGGGGAVLRRGDQRLSVPAAPGGAHGCPCEITAGACGAAVRAQRGLAPGPNSAAVARGPAAGRRSGSPVPGSMAGGGAGRAKRLGTLLSGLLECGAFCGIIFGWASLVYVLKDLQYFGELCQTSPSPSPSPNRTLSDCSGQDEQFSLIFTIGSFMNNFMTLPMGYVFDRFGTAVARLIAISLYTGGTLLVAFSTRDLAVLLFPAMSMLSVGGILLILTNMQVGNLFGKYRSIVITLYNGAFDSSSAIFLIIKVLYERGLPLQAMFLFMAACSAWHLLRTLFLMPRTRIPYPLPPNYNYGLQCPGRSQSYRTYEEKRPPGGEGPEEVPLEPSAPKGSAAPVPFRPCVLLWLFFWHVVWLSVMQLRHYLFIGTLNPLLDHLARGDTNLVSTYTNAFAFTQLCGVLCAPWNGLILDRHKRGKAHHPEGARGALADLQASVLSLVVTVTQCVLFSVCAAVPVLPVQLATFVLQVISRSFLYGGNAAFLAIAFPPQHFGKLYGLAMALSALVALLQYPCIALVNGVLNGD